MDIEGVEAGSEVARDVGKPIVVHQGEYLVILAPELAQPLHGQRLRGDHQTALDLPGVHEPVEDQARFDRLAEANLVCEKPAHRVGGGGALGYVQLMRKQTDAATEERPETVRLAGGEELQVF